MTPLISYRLTKTVASPQYIKYVLTRYFSFWNAIPSVIGEDHLTRVLRRSPLPNHPFRFVGTKPSPIYGPAKRCDVAHALECIILIHILQALNRPKSAPCDIWPPQGIGPGTRRPLVHHGPSEGRTGVEIGLRCLPGAYQWKTAARWPPLSL